MASKRAPVPARAVGKPTTVRFTERGEADVALLADAWDVNAAEAIRRAVQDAAARERAKRKREER